MKRLQYQREMKVLINMHLVKNLNHYLHVRKISKSMQPGLCIVRLNLEAMEKVKEEAYLENDNFCLKSDFTQATTSFMKTKCKCPVRERN